MTSNRRDLRPCVEPTTQRKFPRSLIRTGTWPGIMLAGLMGTGVLLSTLMLLRLALQQLRHPVLYADSWFLTLRDNRHPFAWIFSQHNEHRIVLAKLSTLIETNILGLPITSTFTLQSFLLIALSSGITAILCCRVLDSRWNQLLTWLACSLVLTNPWQWMSFAWEFQMPWFLINTLVMTTTLLLLELCTEQQNIGRRWILLGIATVPWAAIFNNGSGFALVVALCLATLFLNQLAFLVATGSSAFASFTYFKLLNYTNPWAQYTRYGFDPDFFARLLFGGPWQGLAILVFTMSLLFLSGYFFLKSNAAEKTTEGVESIEVHIPTRNIKGWKMALILFNPGTFAIAFALITTISRSSVSLQYADNSWYVTHSQMLAISLIMLASFASNHFAFQPKKRGIATADHRWLLPSMLVVFTTLLSFPQAITRNAPSFRQAWAKANLHRAMAQQTVLCFARRNARSASSGKGSTQTCEGPDASQHSTVIDAYFQGKNEVQPIGWHKILLDGTTDQLRGTRGR